MLTTLLYSRHGLIFPWGHNPKSSAPGRELYIVPLLSSDPIPEYMELLDQLQFPPIRNVDYLVGIWVLTKGKLAPPATLPTPVAAPTMSATPPPVPAPAPAPAPVPQTLAVPNLDLAQLHQLGLLQPPPPSQPPPPPPPSQSTPPIPPHTHPAPYTSPPPSNLAAEVAQLTPEQIQLMLQTLAKTAHPPPVPVPHQPHSEPYGIPLPVHALAPAHGQQQPVSIPQPIALPQAALQAWAGPSPPASSQYPVSYPPQPHPHQQGPPFPGGQQPYGASGGYDRNERPYQNHGNSYEYDRGDRGFRGGRGARGRGGNGGGGGGWLKPRGRGGPAGRNLNRGRGGGGGGGGWGGEQR